MNSPRVAQLVFLVALLIAVGCNGRSYQVASPVIGPVPPREVAAQSPTDKPKPGKPTLTQQASITQVGHAEQQPLGMTDVIAEVNGEPILAHEVLDKYQRQFAAAKQQGIPNADLRKYQMKYIKDDLPKIIQETLMVDAMKTTMKPEQLKSVEAQLDKFFEVQVQRLMVSSGAKSPTELEGGLQSQGMSLVTMRKSFGDQQLVGQYLRSKMGAEPTASREEMLARYDADIDTFTEASEVKWQQIDVSYQVHNGQDEAEAAAQKLLKQIRSGALTFDDAAHDKSDSLLAKSGGHADWTNPESLADADVKLALTTLDVNEISDVIRTAEGCCRIVKVTGRHETRVIPFNEVQKELHDRIVKDKKSAVEVEVLKKLKETAVIHSILDEEDAG